MTTVKKLKEILENKEDSDFDEIDDLDTKRFNTIELSKIFVRLFTRFNSDFKNEKEANEIISKYKSVYESVYEKLLNLEIDSNFGKSELIDGLNQHIIKDSINDFIDLFLEVYSE